MFGLLQRQPEKIDPSSFSNAGFAIESIEKLLRGEGAESAFVPVFSALVVAAATAALVRGA